MIISRNLGFGHALHTSPTFPLQPYPAPHMPAPLQPCTSIQGHQAVSGWVPQVHRYWGRARNWLLVAPQTPTSVCQLLSVLAQVSMGTTPSLPLSFQKNLPVPHPLSLQRKLVFFLLGSMVFYIHIYIIFMAIHPYLCIFLIHISNVPYKSEFKKMDSVVSWVTLPHTPQRPLHILYSGVPTSPGRLPSCMLTEGGFLSCQ